MDNLIYIIFIILIILHVIIWLFVIFGGFISYKCTKIIILLLIPLIYIVHILPFHIISKQKLLYIYNDLDNQLKLYTNEDLNKISNEDLMICRDTYMSLPPNLSKETQDTIVKIDFLNENKFIFPKFYRYIRKYFVNSFADPLSPQGMLILGYIINIYLLYFHWKKVSD